MRHTLPSNRKPEPAEFERVCDEVLAAGAAAGGCFVLFSATHAPLCSCRCAPAACRLTFARAQDGAWEYTRSRPPSACSAYSRASGNAPAPSRTIYEFQRIDVLFYELMYCKPQTNERFRFMGMSSDVRARPFNCHLRQRDA